MIKIRTFKKNDTYSVAMVISSTFKEFNYKEGDKKAVNWYVGLYDPRGERLEKLKDYFSKSEILYVATHNDRIVGVILGNKEHLYNLFVTGRYHQKGIGKRLVRKFEKTCRDKGSKSIRTRASIYATPFYLKLGYKRTTGTRNFKGIRINPMKKTIN